MLINLLRNYLKWSFLAIFLSGGIGLFIGFHYRPKIGKILSDIGVRKNKKQGQDPVLQIWNSVFTDHDYGGELLYPPVQSLDQIKNYQQQLLIDISGFDSIYNELEIANAEQLYFEFNNNKLPVVKLHFYYRQKEYTSYAYGMLPKEPYNKFSSLILPGSGLNQSSAIFSRDQNNYHFGILEAIESLNSDVFVLVKPNEDFLAYHDGKGNKLNNMAMVNYHINRGGSISSSIIMQSMAFFKWIKSNYRNTLIAGLSQGGATTLFISLKTQPTLAIVASGYSVLFNDVNVGGPNQLLGVPGYVDLFSVETLSAKLNKSNTKFFFSWGRMESDYYKLESERKITASAIESLGNVSVSIHEGAHVFPVQEIKDFIKAQNTK